VLDALSSVDDAAARRIVGWLVDKYGVRGDGVLKTNAVGRSNALPQGKVATSVPTEDFAALFAAVSPTTDRDRALVAGYWFQAVQGEPDLDSQTLNKELKNLGHGVGNITKALFHLMNQDPQLVIQTRKSGGSAQARKRYRLTRAGMAHVEGLLARTSG
jgi:hypothetical protein